MSDTNEAPEATQTDELAEPEAISTGDDLAAPQGNTEVFDSDYVNGLKQEAIDHRQKAKSYAARLHTELVRSTGRLADPNDLPFDAAHLEDTDALNSAIDELLTRKPHFAARTPHGDVGQGAKDQVPPVNFISHLKSMV
ncbi:hypothetical protein ACRDU6_13010 [Mycolicibacterium sp. ELW1]|uniref:hypothetical protein n=1 Tax=Mycobacteriaceae TaxID=1762 RepID=UPI0011EFB15B|nr:hypothetical protein [Mycobacterium sp. ELW1]QEN13465.1 hypothetical protein D3H54_09565 [Mycobacterium sp. ELW1]